MARPRKSLTQSMGDSVVKKFISDPDSTRSSELIAIDRIHLPQQQPRRYFDPDRMAQLALSVEEYGILEPLLVRPLANGNYELVAGERRLRAAKMANLTEVPVSVRELDDRQALQVSLLENLQREDLNPVEETEGILHLLAIALDMAPNQVISLLYHAYNSKQRGRELNRTATIQMKIIEDVLAMIGRFNTESFRSNRLPLLNLPADILDVLRQGKLEYTKARLIARLKDIQKRRVVLQKAIKEDLSLTQIREYMKEFIQEPEQEPTLSDRLSLVVRKLKNKKKLDDPKKQHRLETLLQEIELLVEEA